MKFFGNSRSSKHSGKGQREVSAGSNNKRNKKRKRLNTLQRVLIILASVLAVLAIVVVAYWKLAVKPPDVIGSKNNAIKNTSNNSEELDLPSTDSRSGEKYTFLIVGMDDGNGNTDTIMVATFDTSDYSLNIVSIPRDTLVNVSWSVKKANTLYAYGGVDGLKSGIADILGYEVDFYAIIDLDAFIKLVDAIGGIYFDVPVNMNYSDPAQDLYINISKGPQTLSGSDAMKVWRFRATYVQGDIKRIEVQHDLLKAAAEQLLANVDSVPITTLADIVINDVDTDLTYGNVIWFAKELLKMDIENVNIMTIPADYWDEVNGVSYPTIYVDEWLEMINEYLNPFDEDITIDNLDILTRNSSGQLYATSGVKQGKASWGSSSSSSSSGSSNSGGSSSSGGNTGTGTGTTTPTTPSTDPPADGETTNPGETGSENGGETDPGGNTGGETGEGGNTGEIQESDPGGEGGESEPGGESGGSTDTGGENTPPVEENTDSNLTDNAAA